MSASKKAIEAAYSIGHDQMCEWLERRPSGMQLPAVLAAWRARCYADAVHEYEADPDFMVLLAAWESGFDNSTDTHPLPEPAKTPHSSQFSWLPPSLAENQSAHFAAMTLDVCRGVGVCLGIIHASRAEQYFNEDAEPGNKVTPALTSNEAEQLMFLAKAASQLMSDAAERHIDWLINDHHSAVQRLKGEENV